MSTKATILVGLAAALIGLGLLVGLPWLAGVPFRRPDIEGFFMIMILTNRTEFQRSKIPAFTFF